MIDDRHQELRLLVQADIDGELSAREAAAVAVHLDSCDECRALQRSLRTTKENVREAATRHTAPADLRRRIAALSAPAEAATSPPRRPRRAWRVQFGSFGLGAALAAAVLLLAIRLPGGDLAEQSVLDGHLRALQSGHAFDVASTDQHTVKPWFDGKLDFTPPVKDLAAQGFPLKGGRLDTVDGRAVAAMVYGRAKHEIDLYAWPAADGEIAARDTARNGFNFVTWSQGGMRFWAVSDLNGHELHDFVRDWQEAP